MKALYRDKLLKGNEWIDSTDVEYGLILTDDLDSLLSTAILKYVKGWNVEQAYIFKANKPYIKSKDSQLYDYLGTIADATHEAIGVDLALTHGKCFDNHLTQFSWGEKINPESINLNRVQNIYRQNYSKKYNLSTVLLLWSLYDLPKEGLSDELMMLLIAIDGSYEGFYTDARWVGVHEFWMNEVLDLPEFLECERRHTKQEFKAVREKYNIHKGHGKITLQHGLLVTDIDIDAVNDTLGWETDIQVELPTDKFYKKAVFKDNIAGIQGYPSTIKGICDNPFSYALTGKGAVNYSERIEF